jgi:hypothetical protein
LAVFFLIIRGTVIATPSRSVDLRRLRAPIVGLLAAPNDGSRAGSGS